MLPVIIGLLVVIALGYYFQQYNKEWKYLNKIRGPKGLPFIGNALDAGRTPYEFLHNMFKFWRENDMEMFKMYIGNFSIVTISSTKDIEAVLSSNTILKKSPMYDLLHPWLGQGLLTSTGTKWFKHRKMITPSFHFKILVDFLDVMNENSDKFMQQLQAKAEAKDMFDIQDMIHFFTLDTICDTAMGVNINAMDNHDSQIVKAFQTLCYLIQLRTQSITKQSEFLFKFAPEYKEYKNALKVLFDFQEEVIEKRRKILMEDSNSSQETTTDGNENITRRKRAFLDTLLTATVDNKPLTVQDIFEEVSTFMFEGHDTTTSGIAFTTFLLSRHPNIQEKVLEEQKVIFEGDFKRNPTYNDIQEMKYLEMVIKEAQRLYPSVPFIGREPTDFITLSGQTIPPGVSVNLFLMAMGYNDKIFPEPYKFDPERFSLENVSKRSSAYEYVPFSAGPRNCIGQKFAMLELKSVVSKIVRYFEVLPAKDELISKDGYERWEQSEYDPKLAAVLTLKSDNGILIRLRDRNL
ncbi:hypothetical protein ACFFRR_007423 [Megaselia abdita]